ncbi:MAG: hypothetical protein KA732_00515 [Providencia sp.]|uniref:hypothetical protein n=1 Tax=Providencia sp. TaxID=589 RepID=UPI001B4740AC|nr:hypothetical protein [Providencia sp.]MBP6079740.1 hypothetical protein [Providencia sp.]
MDNMKIDKEKLEYVIEKNQEFIQNEKLCACNIAPSIADYSNPLYQAVYVIKYFSAYYFEYCFLANTFYLFLNKIGKRDVNIISLGSGPCPDYYAFMDNLNGINFSYTGVDCNVWNRELFPDVIDTNFSSVIDSAENIEGLDFYDVISFPKSITNIFGVELNDEAKRKIREFVNKLVLSGKNEIIIFISYEFYNAIGHFIYMSEVLNSKKYEIIDSIDSINKSGQYWYLGRRCYSDIYNCYINEDLYSINNDFIFSNTKCDDLSCAIKISCKILHSSLKTNSLMFGNFFVFKRGEHDN